MNRTGRFLLRTLLCLVLLLSLAGSALAMQISVQMLNGKTITLEVETSNSIWNVKEKINAQMGILENLQKLIFGGKILDNDHTLADYNIKQSDTLKLESSRLTPGLSVGTMTVTLSVPYPLWVGGVQVTSKNMDDVLGDGKVVFIPGSSYTLTLNGANITTGQTIGGKTCGIAYTGSIPFVIDLTGENKVAGSTPFDSGIYITDDKMSVTIKGAGSVEASGVESGLFSNSPTVIEGGSVTATATGDGGAGISAISINVNNSSLTATGTGASDAGVSADSIIIWNGIVTATATGDGGAGISVKSISVKNGSVTASGSGKAIGGTVANDEFGTGWTDTAGNQGAAIIEPDGTPRALSDTFKKVQFRGVHVHGFTYDTATANTSSDSVKATCSANYGTCDLTDRTVTLTLVPPTLTTYGEAGKSAAATLSGLDAFNTATGKGVVDTDISYYKATKDEQGVYTKDEVLTTGAPTDAGDYVAQVTLSGVTTAEGTSQSVTASVGYTIARATPEFTTVPSAGAIAYGQTLADSALTGGEASVAGSFAWSDDTVAPAVADSNATDYEVTFTPASANYVTATCMVKLTVNKADPTAKAPTGLTATYGQTLAGVSLTNPEGDMPGTWTWADDTQSVGDVVSPAAAFKANFTPDDTANYKTVENVDVTVTVGKADPTAKAPDGVTATYGQTLADVSLTNPEGNTPGTWAWADGAQGVGDVVSPAAAFKASFTPDDTANYKTVENVDVTVTVGKDDPTAKAPAGVTATYGQTLADVSLTNPDGNTPGTWTWADDTQSVGDVVSPAAAFKASFTPDDTANYKTVENVDVTVTVGKADPTAKAPDGVTATYGQTLADVSLTNPKGNTPGRWAWADGAQGVGDIVTPAAVFKASFTPDDTANYKTVENVDVTVTVGKSDSAVTNAPTAETLIFTDSAQELVTAGTATGGEMQYALGTATKATEAYTASIPTKTNAGTYYVWFKVVGDDNHIDTAAANVPVKIDKAAVTAPTIASKAYNGQVQTADVKRARSTP